jgi:hypothetical protein
MVPTPMDSARWDDAQLNELQTLLLSVDYQEGFT